MPSRKRRQRGGTNSAVQQQQQTQQQRRQQQETRTPWEKYCARLTEEKVLEHSLEFAHYTKIQRDKIMKKTKQRRFRLHYGVSAKPVAALIKDLPPQNNHFKLYDLLMVLSFVKSYNTEEVQVANQRICVNKVNKCVIYYLTSIQLLKSEKFVSVN